MTISEYDFDTCGHVKMRIALVSDLHGRPYRNVIEGLKNKKPDIIAAAGDIIEPNSAYIDGFAFLKECLALAPVYYICGNHEAAVDRKTRADIRQSGIKLLDDGDFPAALTPDMPQYRGKLSCEVHIGGVVSAYCAERRKAEKIDLTDGAVDAVSGKKAVVENSLKADRKKIIAFSRFGRRDTKNGDIDTARLAEFASLGGYKILICHHPEYYERYVKAFPIDLMLCGHAHGGQVRVFGQGIFSPGQGFFPKYTSGVYDGRLVVSRGLANHSVLPRVFNDTELVILNLK